MLLTIDLLLGFLGGGRNKRNKITKGLTQSYLLMIAAILLKTMDIFGIVSLLALSHLAT